MNSVFIWMSDSL